VWITHLRKGGFEIKDKEHFYSIASRAMRQVLVDLARRRIARRRGDGQSTVALDDPATRFHEGTASPEELVAMGTLLEKLDRVHAEAARVFDMHAIVGWTFDEIAEITGLTTRQVRHLWQKSQNWLKDRLKS
jgi:RNA polymerase sigma factor (TIGR02999 family)